MKEKQEERIKTPEELEKERIHSKRKDRALIVANKSSDTINAYPRGSFINQLAEFLIREDLVK